MGRKLSDISLGNEMPPKGWHIVRCKATEDFVSSNKGTKAVKLKFITRNGEGFDDLAFLTAKALSRLSLISRRLCNAPDDLDIPDDDDQAVRFLAGYIHDNAVGKDVNIEIIEVPETFMCESGPDIGQMKTVTKRKVSYNGYRRMVAESGPARVDAF